TSTNSQRLVVRPSFWIITSAICSAVPSRNWTLEEIEALGSVISAAPDRQGAGAGVLRTGRRVAMVPQIPGRPGARHRGVGARLRGPGVAPAAAARSDMTDKAA